MVKRLTISVHIRVFLHGLFSVVKLKFIDHAAVFVPRILYLDRRAVKDIGICFGEIRSESFSAIIRRKAAVRLIFDLGVEAYCLHRGYDAGQPHQIWVVLLAERLKLHTGSNEALQLGKVLERDRLPLFF